MMSLVAAVVGGMGLVCLLSRRTLLGVLIGVQLIVIGATMMFVIAGIESGARLHGHIAGLLITLGGVAQIVGGYALAIRMFYLKNRITMDELRSLKR